MAEPITLYGKPTCPHAFNARRELENRGVEYTYVDVLEDKTALEEMLRVNGGLRRVPTIVEGDRVTVGYKGKY